MVTFHSVIVEQLAYDVLKHRNKLLIYVYFSSNTLQMTSENLSISKGIVLTIFFFFIIVSCHDMKVVLGSKTKHYSECSLLCASQH